jgi:crotonobetainyl-CoA:carnitine CoA-transferase CaiB-like acyl-CoA transferase
MSRIIDLTSETGAYGAHLLAEMGHDVVRVEPPSGDRVRGMAPLIGPEGDSESSAFHQYWNAGKRSLTLDLKSEQGKRTLLALVRKSDAMVASLPLPVDEAALREANPRLVLVRLDDGPPEICAYARSGLMAITGDPSSSPVLMGGHIPLSAIGTYLATAASAALMVQQITGQGQAVDVSAQQCLGALAEQTTIEFQSAGEVLERRGKRGGVTAVAGALACRDGYWMVSAPPTSRGWVNFLEMTKIPALMEDASLVEEASRKEKKDFILDTVEAWSADKDAGPLVERAQELHLPATPVTTALHLTNDPQLEARGFLREIDHPRFGRVKVPAGALAALWGTKMRNAPRLGEHNAEILAELNSDGGKQS